MRLLPLLACVLALPAFAQGAFDPDTVQAQPLDNGKMWLFEDPPTEYFETTYGFAPDDAWYRRARLASLRMPGCSASFVSPHGLVLTNHHCAQSWVIASDRGEEGLLDNGFSAHSLDEERPVTGLYMDQLVDIADVTSEMSAPVDAAETDAERAAALEASEAAVTARLLAAYGITSPDPEADDYVVQVVGLYNGGRYSAYTFRRYRDVRLAMAPERALGFFGGDSDNFTYPRYAADFAFFRIYENGEPLATDEFFPLSTEGVETGSLVFVIGNPGRTSRGLTVAELEFLRDVGLIGTARYIETREQALRAYLATGEAPNPDQLRGQIFGLSNSRKAYNGRLRGLNDTYVIARRAADEKAFRAASPAAAALIDEQAQIQAEKREMAAAYRLFPTLFGRYSSSLMQRALALARDDDAALADTPEQPESLERAFLIAQVEAIRDYYHQLGEDLPAGVDGPTAEAAADRLLDTSIAARPNAPSDQPANDAAVALVQDLLPRAQAWQSAAAGLQAREGDLSRRLGRERFATYGNAVPPDATFSLRFTDGVVSGYPYNGTLAPPMTTLYGLYDHYYSYCASGASDPCEWDLPAQWLDAVGQIDLSTPVNFTSTSDTIGGNSGSPTINRRGELVGLNFDRTIEGLVRDYIYDPTRGRNVMVDTRLVVEALSTVYGLDGLVREIREGALRE